MKRLNSNVGSTKAALQERPEVLKAVRVDAPINISLGMVNELMHESVMEFVIAHRIVAVDLGSVFDVVQDFVLQNLASSVRDYRCTNLTQIAVKNSLYYSLAMVPAHLLVTQSAILVHVASLTANPSLVNFDFGFWSSTADFGGIPRTAMQSLTDALKHEPSGSLCDADSPGEFVARHSIFAGNEHPNGNHPLIQRDSRIFEDRIDLERELFFAVVAEPEPPFLGFDKRVLLGAATWTGDLAIWPAELNGVLKSLFWIGEINDGLLECFRRLHENIVH